MKNIPLLAIAIFMILLTGCSSKESLQEYYVGRSEDSNFLSFDIPSSVLQLNDSKLSAVEKEAISSFKKLNVLAFKKNEDNAIEFLKEKTVVNEILNNDDFVELMKMNTPYGKASVKYIGDEDAIDEVIIFGSNPENGFALIRILGDNMNPAHMIQLLNTVQKSDYKGQGLEQFGKLFK